MRRREREGKGERTSDLIIGSADLSMGQMREGREAGREGRWQSPKGQRPEQRRYHINPLRSPPSLTLPPLPGPVTRKGHLRSHSISRRRCAAAGGGANNPTKASPIFRLRAGRPHGREAEPVHDCGSARIALDQICKIIV